MLGPKGKESPYKRLRRPFGLWMAVAASILVFLVGAILYLALDLDTAGLILIVAGVLGVALGLLQQALLARGGRRRPPQPK